MLGATVAALAACVTINVYFPEAAAQDAADRFIEEVIGPELEPEAAPENTRLQRRQNAPGEDSMAQRLIVGIVNLVIPPAHAQVNIDINTPEIRAIQARMAQRFSQTLATHFSSGAIGLTNDARVAVRDLSKVGLRDRSSLNAAIAAENRDRDAVYREIAVANGQPGWESQIRQTFARRWISNARPGWYFQDAQGAWAQK